MSDTLRLIATGPVLLYDGEETNWWTQPMVLQLVDGRDYLATIARDAHALEKLLPRLVSAYWSQLRLEAQIQVCDWSGYGNLSYKGINDLAVSYVQQGAQLWLLAAGEKQPCRYQTHLLGSWLFPTIPAK